jgi:hypothetical protein
VKEEILFSKNDIFNVLEGQKQAVKKRVESIDVNTILNASEHDLVQALVEEFRLEVPVLREKEIYIADACETQVDVSGDPNRLFMFDHSGPFHVPGNKTVIAVPYEGGEADFFRIQPQTYGSVSPRAEIRDGELLLTYMRTDQNAVALKRDYEEAVKYIKESLLRLSQSAAQFNGQLEGLATSHLKARKDRLLADAGMVAAIGLPMKKRQGVPVTYAVPVVRRRPKIEQIKVAGSFTPEPVLAQSEYEEILGIMKNMALVMERSPHAFLETGEDALRMHFLVQLNGAYEGDATGETFNFDGKTDVLIRKDGKNVFIAECKFWTGEKAFLETIDQLLSYLSWRDTKTAVVVFNRNAGFSAVLAKIAEITPKHPQFKRDLGKSDESTFRYVFAQPNDANREITLTVMAFDIPTPR